MGLFECPRALASGQPGGSRRWHPCCCRCLLKDCERWFLPPRPQARYCSPTCQKAAAHWRSWHACQTYRATIQGKERRREQAQRRRERQRQRAAFAEPAPQTPPTEPALPVIEVQTTFTSDSTPSYSRRLPQRRPAPSRNLPRFLRFAVQQAWVLRLVPALALFSRSTFLFRLMPSGITASSPARSPTQAPPTPRGIQAVTFVLVADRPQAFSVMSSRT